MLAILAVIAAIAVPTAFGAITEAQVAADTASVEGFNSAIRMQATILRATPTTGTTPNGTGLNSPQNDWVDAILNSRIDTKKPPQSNKEIGLEWVPPTANSIGYFKILQDGTNITNAKEGAWLQILNDAVVAAAGSDMQIAK